MKFLKRAAAGFAAAAILLTNTVFCYADGYETVKVTSQTDYRLNYSNTAKFSVKTGTYSKGDKRKNYGAKVFTIEASPKTTRIAASGGKSVYSKKTLTDIISQTDTKGSQVIGAINADFFSTATGIPLGLEITDGRIVTTNIKDDKSAAVGFKADGSTVFGTPDFEISLTVNDYTVKIDKVNRQNNYTNHIILFTSDFSDKTYWGVNEKGTGYDVIVLSTESALPADGKITCYYEAFLQNIKDPVAIEKDKIYICAPTGAFVGFEPPLYQEIDGQKVYFDRSFVSVTEKTGKWKGVINAVSGGNLLINNGVIRYPSTYDSSIRNMLTSRSAFGVKADGTYVFYAAEHSASVSGIWMEAVAQAMFDMGCIYAINLDGGGSTTFAANTGGGLLVQNKCQDGSQRKIANALLFLSDETAPVVAEDFEGDKQFTEVYEGTNLITASITKENAYTGKGALKLDYSLRGIGNSVGVTFQPIDVSKYKMLSVAINEMGSGVRVDAKLKNGKKEFTRTILKGNEKNYVRAQVDVSDATELIGFEVAYELAAKNRNSILIDRIAGLGADMRYDVEAPTVSVSSKNEKLSITSSKPLFTSQPDVAEVVVDGGEMLVTNTLETKDYSDDKVHKAKIGVIDTLGNRTVAYQLFKTAGYSVEAPFADLNDKKWDALAIRYCYENGIINGIKENGTLTYKGDKNVTRAEFCVMIVNRKKLNINKYVGVKLPYKDTDSIPKWALLYIKAAYAEGIMTGSKTADGIVFSPNADITRQEAASALDRLIEKDTRLVGKVKYSDKKAFAKWAKKYIESASTQGLFMGNEQGKFQPENSLTRSESAVLMSKL